MNTDRRTISFKGKIIRLTRTKSKGNLCHGCFLYENKATAHNACWCLPRQVWTRMPDMNSLTKVI